MKAQPKKYWKPRYGLFFPKFGSKKKYKIFDGEQYELDSWCSNKQGKEARKSVIKNSGYNIRVVKRKRLYFLYKRS